MATISERVGKVIGTQLGVEKDQVIPEASIQDDLGADSLDIVDLVMAIEDEFRIEVPDEDAKMLATVGQITAYLEEKLGTKT